jgi:NAD(P)-dependent dehydrogenase (short-subunit alcohol dehydrogenase family)
MGVDIVQAALAAGHAVVATGRNPDAVANAIGENDDLLVAELDITHSSSARTAVQAASDRFGRIDVLVNNPGNFACRVLRGAVAGTVGGAVDNEPSWACERDSRRTSGDAKTALGAHRHAVVDRGHRRPRVLLRVRRLEVRPGGGMESLRFEVEPFGIQTTIVEPGFFRTDLLTKESTAYADLSIDDYAERTAQTRPAWEAMNGKQTNDPAKLAKALLTVVDQQQPPLRWVAGADAVATVEQKANELLAQVDAYRDLSSSLAVEETSAGEGNL